MARHFSGLFLLIVTTLIAASWCQDRLLQAFGGQSSPEDAALTVALAVLRDDLQRLPPSEWPRFVAAKSMESHVHMELFAAHDIVGDATKEPLAHGRIAHMRTSHGESWLLMPVNDDYVLALESVGTEPKRSLLDWSLTLAFYATIALVIMIWIWPLTRDLRILEGAVARFGDRNWRFEAPLAPHSQIYPLAATFRRMAARIDALITSHKDMSNAVSHEIRTPLARMQFEIELASRKEHVAEARQCLDNIKADIREIDDLVTTTLDYAILERADLSLNLGTHDFAALVPAIAAAVRRDTRPQLRVSTEIRGDAAHVVCDGHLMESVLKNLLYNAIRYARRDIHVTFEAADGVNRLIVDDDGPGIPEGDRVRVFESFVQLGRGGRKYGFGLGLAIVKRTIEWHAGEVSIVDSPLGGARLSASWPATPAV